MRLGLAPMKPAALLAAAGIGAALVAMSTPYRMAAARPVQAVLEAEQDIQADARASQGRIDELSEQTEGLVAEYLEVVHMTADLEAYNEQLEELIAEQQRKLVSFAARLAAAEDTQRHIVPLLNRMLEVLARFVAADLPFLQREREARLSDLRATLDDPEQPMAEKYRRVMEAYQVELDYGRTIEAYRDRIEIGGAEQVVEMLRVGRVALLYATVDERAAGIWDPASATYRPLDAAFVEPVRRGLQVARKELPPEMLRIPIPGVAR